MRRYQTLSKLDLERAGDPGALIRHVINYLRETMIMAGANDDKLETRIWEDKDTLYFKMRDPTI